MDIFFADPSEVPLPPEDVRILDLKVEPYPDGRRVRVLMEVTPFLKKPHGDIFIKNNLGALVSTTSFIEAVTSKIEMTLHLREQKPGGTYTATAVLFYTREVEDEVQGDRVLVKPEKQVVDSFEVPFSIPTSD